MDELAESISPSLPILKCQPVDVIVSERIHLSRVRLQSTGVFDDWLRGLEDRKARARILTRLDSAQFGNLGDVCRVISEDKTDGQTKS